MNIFEEKAKKLVAQMTLAEKISQMQHNSPAIERLGIPGYNWWNECLHGLARSGAATVFPQAIALAASFNTKLMQKVAKAISDEARAKYNEYKKFGKTEIYQGLTMWSPNINIFRDPRWGRGQETYGEDPYLTGEMAVSFIKGLQGSGKYRKLDATIKHYAAHSGPESERHSFNAKVSKKDLYETYLAAFKYCIDRADPAAVMGAYNAINGEHSCASETYLKGVLFGEFGFRGYVVSDCGAICDINLHHRLTENEAESAALAVKNGCHLNCGSAYKWLKTAVAMGLIEEEEITRAAEKLFTARYRLGMFAKDCEYDNIPYEVVECEEHIALSLKMAQEGIVLLKNDGILPLKGIKSIAVLGPNADSKNILLGNYNGTPSGYTTLLRGIQEATDAKIYYARGCEFFEDNLAYWAPRPLNEAIIAAQKADVIIMCMGLDSSFEGEEGDSYNGGFGGDKRDLELPPAQIGLYNEIKKLGRPIVFVNVSGSAINLSAQDEECAAVLQCFYPGAEGGRALSNILFGKVSPSGRLPITFYKTADDLPPFEDYSMEGRTYKYMKGDALYPFGFGLSYSRFSYSDFTACADVKEKGKKCAEKGIKCAVNVTNMGEYDSGEVVELYIKYDGKAPGFALPNCQLRGFKRVFLKKGEEKRVEFLLTEKDFFSIDNEGKNVLLSGSYSIFVGGSAPDGRSAHLTGGGCLSQKVELAGS